MTTIGSTITEKQMLASTVRAFTQIPHLWEIQEDFSRIFVILAIRTAAWYCAFLNPLAQTYNTLENLSTIPDKSEANTYFNYCFFLSDLL